MLKFQSQIWDTISKHSSSLVISGRGMDLFEIIKRQCVESMKNNQKIIVFGLTEPEKLQINLTLADCNFEFSPKDIEKAISRSERIQLYQSQTIFFVIPNLFAKDILTECVDPANIDGIIVSKAEQVVSDPGIQLSLTLFKSKNPSGFIRAFSERVYLVQNISRISKFLCIDFILFYPRFEDTVNESIKPLDSQLIDISIKKKSSDEITLIVDDELIRVFYLFRALLKSVLREASVLKLKESDIFVLPRKSLIERAKSDEESRYMESILFLKKAYFLLLHDYPSTYSQFVNNQSYNYFDRPLWLSLPEAATFLTASMNYGKIDTPSPKLQWITHLLSKIPSPATIMILADGSSTISMLVNYLFQYRPSKGKIVVDMDEDGVNPDYFGLIAPPIIVVQELTAQVDGFMKVMPDVVIFHDVSLLSLRRLEIYASKVNKKVSSYILSYNEANELEIMQRSAELENQVFIECIKSSKSLNITPFKPYNLGKRIIIADEREFRSAQPLALIKAGFTIIPKTLIVGDYVISDDIVVERKSYQDLVGSLKSGRLIQQIERMISFYKKPILMLEFSEDVPFNAISSVNHNNSVITKLAIILKNYPQLRLLWGRTPFECAAALMKISITTSPPNTETATEMGRQNIDSQALSFLKSIPFLNKTSVDSIVNKCSNLVELVKMSKNELINLLGASTGLKLYNFLHGKLTIAS